LANPVVTVVFEAVGKDHEVIGSDLIVSEWTVAYAVETFGTYF
jgi:hypothetical protein